MESNALDIMLSKNLLALYTRSGYGKVLKSEIDALVFHHLLPKKLDQKYVKINEKAEDPKDQITIDYFSLDKTLLYNLSQKLKLSEARLQHLLEEDFFEYQKNSEDAALPALLLDMVNRRSITKEQLKDGKIRFSVANPMLRKLLEVKIYESGGMVDYSFSREVMVIDLYDFLKLLNLEKDERIIAIIENNILKKAKSSDEHGEKAKAFFRELEKKPLQEQLKAIAVDGAKKFIGAAGGETFGLIWDTAEKHLKTIGATTVQ
jgi:hypothetical protein